ncbi:MAG TPA: 1-deoxy-D-xylulose-5-phosphate synthase [bacterium]|nr:1-deoxy-D-xylulose-5-phosphate synthase [bacterium]
MYEYLDKIESPAQLRALAPEALPKVAEELRDFLLTSVSKTGGHLGSSLGAVELTLALHYVYDTPQDRIVWDVGHQAYGHKALTGRRELFPTLRQFKGLCGFPKRNESEYDTFAVGHAGTALSAAYGMSRARDMQKKEFQVVAVVGDASISNGLSMEALNHIGDDPNLNMTVILNDNEMSISPSVGSMTAYLNKILAGKSYNEAKTHVERFIDRIPKVGHQMLAMTHHAEEALKGFMTPGTLFEELGLRYYGPIDGHDLRTLVEIFKKVKQLKGPILLHVVTQKGKGYSFAEENPEKFHGVTVFDKETGKSTSAPVAGAPPAYTKVFGDTMIELAQQDPRIVAITAGMPEGTGLKKFGESFPDRFIDVGIAEGHGVCMAAGLACEGMVPVAAIYSTFLQRAYDQIIHDVCLQKLPVVFALDRGGLVGEDGETHQGVYDLSYLRCVPNMTVMAPADENELRHMLYTAVGHGAPIALRYPRGNGEGVALDPVLKKLEIGKGVQLEEGKDFALLAIGRMVGVAKQVREMLKKEGLEGAVANMRFVKPLDEALLLSLARKSKVLLTLEENVLMGGFGSAVLEALQKNGVSDIAVRCVGIPDKYIEHGKPQLQREMCGLEPSQVAQAVREVLKDQKPYMLGVV